MNALHLSDSRPTPGPERRLHRAPPGSAPRRRIQDTFFNRVRWPAFVFAWFIAGLAVLLLLLNRVS